MKLSGNTILITGGATGIGFALAKQFAQRGNTVIICGRRSEKLEAAKQAVPGLHTFTCDVSKPEGQRALHKWVAENFKEINVLVNNAGIQKYVDFKNGIGSLEAGDDEVDTNFKSVINLSALFMPDFLKRENAAVINISSGLGFIPMARFPVYCATKAAVHALSISMRHQLAGTSVKVFELIPPTVETELDHGSRKQRNMSGVQVMQPDEFAALSLAAIEADKYEYAAGPAEGLRMGARNNFEEWFKRING